MTCLIWELRYMRLNYGNSGIIPERFNTDFAVKEGQNIRKLKKDVLDKARKLFPNQLFLNKNKNEDMRPEYCSDCHRP